MAEPYLTDIVGQYQRGQAIGTAQRQEREERARQSRLSELASLAYGAQGPERQAAIGQAYGVDPQFAAQLSGQLGKDEEASRARLLATARLIKAAPPEQKEAIFQRVRPALSNDLPNLPLNYNDQVGQGIDAYISAYSGDGDSLPAGYRQLDLAARAAGYEPGTPDYQNYFRVAGGIQGRAPSAGFGFETVPGVGITRRNPRTGQVEVYDQLTGDFTPIGTGASINAPTPQSQVPAQGGMVVTNPATGERGRFSIGPDGQPLFIAEGVAPNVQQGIAADPTAFQQPTAQAPAQFVSAPPPAVQRFGEITSRTPEQQAFLTEQEKERARLEAYDRATGSEVDRAARTEFAKETAKAQAALQNIQSKRSAQSADVIALLDAAEPLIKRSTGSGIGAAVDAAAGFVGQSTAGADAISALQPIAAALVGNVPRMEGPQSDRDVQLYREAAGNVADATIPQSRRLAAIKTMRDLQKKYQSLNQGDQAPARQAPSQPAPQQGWGIRRVR